MNHDHLDFLDYHVIETTASAGVPFRDTVLGSTVRACLSLHKLRHDTHVLTLWRRSAIKVQEEIWRMSQKRP